VAQVEHMARAARGPPQHVVDACEQAFAWRQQQGGVEIADGRWSKACATIRRTAAGAGVPSLDQARTRMMPLYDAGMRTIIEIPEAQLHALRDLCRREKVSRAEAIRRAVADYARSKQAGAGQQAFGLWRRRRLDGLAYQRRLRRGW
jgi:Ribbon-helix-helix protein, copG family